MKIKKKKNNNGSQVGSQGDRLQGSFLRQCRKTLLITASYQLFSVCVSPTAVPLPPAKPGYDQTLLSTVSNQVSQFFASPAIAAAPPVGPSGCVALTGGAGPPAGMPRMPAALGGMMIMNTVLQVAMQGMMQGAANAQVQAQHKAQFAQMQQWLDAEQSRLANLVSQQRSLRDAESKAGLDEIAKAMSDQWDGGKGPTDVASALSDPGVVDLRPQGTPFFGTGGDSSVVDLRDRTQDTPQIPDGKKPPPGKMASKPVPQSETARKLQKMIRDNQDPAKLDTNLEKLEDQLAKTKDLSEKIKQGTNFSPQDLEAYDRCLAQVTKEGLLRGLSLIMDFRGDQASGPQGLINWYKEMKANPARMNQLLNAMNNINEFAEFADRYDKFKPGELKDVMWNEANRNLMRDLDFFRTQNAVNPSQFQSGKKMVKESMGLAEGREELGKIEVRVKIQGLSPFFWDRKKQLDQQAQKLAETTRGARRELALKKDLPPTPGKPGQASPKPPPAPARASSIPVIDNLKVIPLDLKQPPEKSGPATKELRGEPPLPAPKYRQVVFQGVVGSQQEDRGLLKAIQNNPLFQDPDQSYVFAFPGGPQSDRLMYQPESHRDYFFKKLPEMKGMEVERLVLTGNMAPMVEMFLRERFIKVKHLVFITNDTSKNYPKQEALMSLARERGIWFSWYLNRDGKLVNFVSPSGVNHKAVIPDF